MKILINYGDETVPLLLSDSVICDDIHSAGGEIPIDAGKFMAEVEAAERSLFPISEATLLIINDAYRPTPTGMLLKWLFDSGRINSQVKILIASGCHAQPSESQLKNIFGEMYSELRNRILVHNADDLTQMKPVGQDHQGETVYLNRAILENDKIVIISSVEPHYFAGFTGGRKSIFPGVCDRATTTRNHNQAISFKASPMKLDGNPIEEHFRFLMNMIGERRLFGIQLVLGRDNEISSVFCGELMQAFEKAVSRSREIFGKAVKSKYDLILAEVLPPLDSNLYQLQKALENCQDAVRDGGAIILFSICREGIGSEDFFQLAERWQPNGSVQINPEDTFGIHKLHRVFRIGRRIDIYLYSGLPKGIPERVYFRSCQSPQDIIDRLAEDSFDSVRMAVVRDAGHTVLTVH